MIDQKFVVRINKPIEEVFAFITNPASTPEWINSIVKEESEDASFQIGTIIRNWDMKGNMNEYKVTAYDKPAVFQLESTVADYKLRYTCTPVSDTQTSFEYYEWSDSGELHSSSMREILNKLKMVLEQDKPLQ